MSNDYKPNRIVSFLRVEAGSLEEEDYERGLAHFIEHMAFDKTKQFPARGGVWDAITRSGAGEFNAFTTFKTTTFQLFDFPADRIEEAFRIHAAQVNGMDPDQVFVTAEAGAILGEARYRNQTSRIQTDYILENHGGPDWRIPKRFTIGLPEQIEKFTAEGMMKFYSKWYRPERFTIIVVGNVTFEAAEASIKKVFGPLTPLTTGPVPERPSDGVIRVKEPLVLRELPGVDGIEFHLMCTKPYVSPKKFTSAYFREAHLRKIFSTAYALLIHVRLAEMYPEEVLSDAGGRDASIKIRNEYQLGVEAHVLTISTPGDSLAGTWRRDFDIAVTELRRLAFHGLHGALLDSLMGIRSRVLREGLSRSGWEDSKSLADDILGSGDPDEVFIDPVEEARLGLPYLDDSFIEAAQAFVKAEARFLYRSLIEAAGAEKASGGAYDKELFSELAPSRGNTSLYIFTGKPDAGIGARAVREADKFVPDDFRQAVYQIESSIPPPNILIDHFLLLLSRGLKLGGVEIPGTAPPIGVPQTGTLFNQDRILAKGLEMPLESPVQNNSRMAIRTWELPNKIRVNVKERASGYNKDPASEPGKAVMQIVSLGGRATETEALAGACKFVNLELASGYSATYYDNLGAYDTRDFDVTTITSYFKGARVPAKLMCEEEFFVIEKVLHEACEIYPEGNKKDCDPANHNYFPKLEGVRLAMSPRYDSRSIDLGAAKIREELEELNREADPIENLRYRGVERGLESLFTDSRLARPTEARIRALDPLSVQAWVREQFLPERIEINVVGDVDIMKLIYQLNVVFGTLPRNVTKAANITTDHAHTQHRMTDRVGLDVYDPKQVEKFNNRKIFRSQSVKTSCVFESAVPDRGFVSLYFPAQDFRQIDRNRFLTDPILHDQVYNAIRREGSFAYFIQQESFHSVLFPGWGYHKVTWAPGTWPRRRALGSNNKELVEVNIEDSIKKAVSAMTSPLTQEIYNTSLPQVQAKLEINLSRLEDWLIIMRGISLPPPATWTDSFGKGIPGFKNINHTDIWDYVKTTAAAPSAYSAAKSIASDHITHGRDAPYYFLESKLITVPVGTPDIACPN